MNSPTQIDTAPIVSAIEQLFAFGADEHAVFSAVARRFPNLTSAELSAALQDATAAAERRIARP
jgi:hypothetical protein